MVFTLDKLSSASLNSSVWGKVDQSGSNPLIRQVNRTIMFRGTHTLSLDSKGRLAIPAKFREPLVQTCAGRLVCTVDIKLPCLFLYPEPQWQEIEEKLANLSSMRPEERRLQRLLVGYAHECEMDKNGRFLLPPVLRQYIQLDKRVALVGQLNKFEIWDEQRWLEQCEADVAAFAQGDGDINERLMDISL